MDNLGPSSGPLPPTESKPKPPKKKSWKPSRAAKILIAAVVGLVLIASALFLILGRSAGLATAPGFLGTRAGLFADFNLLAEILQLAGLTAGYFLVKRGNYAAHQYNQTAWVFFNIVLTILIMEVAFNRQVVPGIPEKLLRTYYGVATVHAMLGGATILLAIYIVLHRNNLIPKALRWKKWKLLMQIALALYWAVGLFGLATYYYWYVAPREATGAPETAGVAQAGRLPPERRCAALGSHGGDFGGVSIPGALAG